MQLAKDVIPTNAEIDLRLYLGLTFIIIELPRACPN